MTLPTVRRQRAWDRPVHIEQPIFATPLLQRPPEYSGLVPLPGWTPPVAEAAHPHPLDFQQQQNVYAVNPLEFSGLAPLPGWTAPVTITANPQPLGFQQQQHMFAVNPPIAVPVRYLPVPVMAYPGLPRHAIAHHDRQAAHRNWQHRHPNSSTTNQPVIPLRSAIAQQPATTSRRSHAPAQLHPMPVPHAQHLLPAQAAALPPPHAAPPHQNVPVQINDPGPAPQGCRPYVEPNARHSIGSMNVECPDCRALHCIGEKLAKS